jgi:hypothetical protein
MKYCKVTVTALGRSTHASKELTILANSPEKAKETAMEVAMAIDVAEWEEAGLKFYVGNPVELDPINGASAFAESIVQLRLITGTSSPLTV